MEIPLLSWVSHFFIAAPNVSFREIILKEDKFALYHGLIDFGTQQAGSTDFRPMAQQDHGQRAWQKKKKLHTLWQPENKKRGKKGTRLCLSGVLLWRLLYSFKQGPHLPCSTPPNNTTTLCIHQGIDPLVDSDSWNRITFQIATKTWRHEPLGEAKICVYSP